MIESFFDINHKALIGLALRLGISTRGCVDQSHLNIEVSRKMQGTDNLTKNNKCSLYHLHNTLGYSLLPLELHLFRVLDPHPLLAPLYLEL
jgi:hypothetical protein